jgi:hypothetical protein
LDCLYFCDVGINYMNMEKTKQLVKEYETKGKIKVNWETGDIEFLIKDKKEIENIHQKIAFSSPQALLDTLWRSERDKG